MTELTGDRNAGTYVCRRCTNRMTVVSAGRLSPCPVCGGDDWRTGDDQVPSFLGSLGAQSEDRAVRPPAS